MEKLTRAKVRKQKIVLSLCNALLIIGMLLAAWVYSRAIYQTQVETKTTDFIRTIESMKQVSQNYLDSERGYVRNWAAYIGSQDMTLDEALDFLRSINTNKERFAHIVDMDTYEAYSSYYPKGEEWIDTYVKYKEKNIEAEEPFGDIMEHMFEGSGDEFEVLGKYRMQETQAMAVGIGTRVTLKTEDGTKDYLLLRIVPTDELKRAWVFPMEYSSAEVGIISNTGDYVIQSYSMKSQNFLEYIRGYNFQDDYNAVKALRQKLATSDSGTLYYQNFRGNDCLWYYSSFGSNSALDILGVINMKELQASIDAWYIVIIVCGTLIILMLVDGLYLVSINRRLRESVKMAEQASRAKTQFLSAMSHDIRTPLNAVLGMMTIAQKKADEPQQVIDCMDKGIRSGRQLLTLINDVLDISKIESGKVMLNPEHVDLDEIIQELAEILEEAAERKNIALEEDFANLPHKYLYADRMRLTQIYVNLLSNAVKYTQDNGRIVLKLYEEELADRPRYTRLVFCVKDNGIGMTQEFQSHMYNTFSREVKTQVNSTQGTGLGLAIVKQMVDLMNGTIACDSKPGNGTTFTVTVDLAIVEKQQEEPVEEIPLQDVQDMHLLVAEDNELNWEIIQELLQEQGITCDHAENGRQCVDMLSQAPAGTYQAILMDVHMPVMNGYEATKAIRSLADKSINNTIIIAMTADAFAEDVQACLACGMNGHVAKPVDINKLMGYLEKLTGTQA